MPLFVDATALVSLGHVDGIRLLRHVDPEVVISAFVAVETRQWHDQIEAGVAQGWLRIETPSRTEVDALQEASGLHGGEAETILLAWHSTSSGRADTKLLIDEGPAFGYLIGVMSGRPRIRLDLLCLAEVLHLLEAGAHVASARATMQLLMANGHYRWASRVRRHYEDWCTQHGVVPIPMS